MWGVTPPPGSTHVSTWSTSTPSSLVRQKRLRILSTGSTVRSGAFAVSPLIAISSSDRAVT